MALLDVKGLYKAFGLTQALSDVSLTCDAGEIHGIMGENGSGKSTLVKVLAGIVQPDRGIIRLKDQEVRIRSVMDARRLGITSVSQEILVVPALTVIENVALGRGHLWSGAPTATFRDTVQRLFQRLSEQPIVLDDAVETLPLAKQQLVAIVRTLVQDSVLIILDESTSALDVADRDQLFDYLRDLRSQGKTIIYISHRIDELQGLADRMTILRNGHAVGTIDARSASVDEILQRMSGEARTLTSLTTNAPSDDSGPAPRTVLWTEHLKVHPTDLPIDFKVAAGEIVGLAGLEGHGQEQFLQVLAGLQPVAEGHVRVQDDPRPIRTLRQAYKQGIVYLPKDRKTEGLMLKLSILDNFALPLYSGVLHTRDLRQRFTQFSEQLRIVFGSTEQAVGSLSGGNQQKIILARWLATQPRVLLLNDPTRGVDIPTKRDLYEMFRQLQHTGVTVVLLSTDLEELLTLCPRVLVFREGQVHAELKGTALTRDNLIATMFGKAG